MMEAESSFGGEASSFSEGSDIDRKDEADNSYCEPYEPEDEDSWMREVSCDEEDEDDNKEGIKDSATQWKTDDYHRIFTSSFNRRPGVKVDLPKDSTPMEAFAHIFTEELWSHLVTQTNIYASQTTCKTPSRPKAAKWAPVTQAEMKTFVGLCIAMGLIHLPVRRDYWRHKKDLFQTRISKYMSRDKYHLIWRYLHLQDNRAADVNRSDKLWKMRWFLNYLHVRFQSLYEVDGTVTVDESMIKFKGNLSFRQYLPTKSTKWGIKVWVMAESSTGYVSNFQVYTGREGTEEKGLSHRVVMDLARPYYGSHLSIYMDSFYTGVELFREMKTYGLNACGTVRANRKGLPKTDMLTKRESPRGHEFRVAQKDELTFCIWQDTKTLMVLSNHHDPTATGTVTRKKEGAGQTDVVVPACLADYQKHMKGVDLLDQMVGYYGFQHRSKKWWRRVFFYFLGVSCHNAYVAAKSVGGAAFKRKYTTYKNWLEDLAEQLITPVLARCAPEFPPSPSPSLAPVASRTTTPPKHDFGKIFQKRKACRECQLLPENERAGGPTVYGCKQCEQPLHIECFGSHYQRFL